MKRLNHILIVTVVIATFTGCVSVSVVDSETGEPVRGADVTIMYAEPGFGYGPRFTDAEGIANINNVLAIGGEGVKVVVGADGYDATTIDTTGLKTDRLVVPIQRSEPTPDS